MSVNNPVGDIPIATPMLGRVLDAAWTAYSNMTENEVRALEKEIKSVTETNCDYKIYDIAQMLKSSVDIAVNGI